MCTRNENSLPARFFDLYKLFRTAAYSRRLFTLAVIMCGFLFSGCVGTGDNSSANQSQGLPNGSVANQPQTAQDGSARAQLTILWPSQSSAQADNEHIKLIPKASTAITVIITSNSTLGTSPTVTSQTVGRPASGNLSTVIFSPLPVGTFTVTATAYPDASGMGVAQAKGTATLTTQAGQTATLAITMASTIDHLVITSTTTTVPIGSTLPLTVTAYDATGAIVLVGNSYLWQCGTPTIVSVNPDGVLTGDSAVLTGVSAGQTTISVEETESVKTGTITITVPPFIVTPNPAIVTIGTTTQLSVLTLDANGNTIQLPLSDFTFTSAAPSVATVDSNGVVTGVSPGSTIVTASDTLYPSDTGTATITVSPFIVTPNPPWIYAPMGVYAGTTAQLSVSTLDENGNTIQLPLSDYTFTSAVPSIATVDPNGVVMGVTVGTTIVTATDINSGITGTVSVGVMWNYQNIYEYSTVYGEDSLTFTICGVGLLSDISSSDVCTEGLYNEIEGYGALVTGATYTLTVEYYGYGTYPGYNTPLTILHFMKYDANGLEPPFAELTEVVGPGLNTFNWSFTVPSR